MTKQDENHPKPSLAQQDALKRLDQVEEEKRKPYKKKRTCKFSLNHNDIALDFDIGFNDRQLFCSLINSKN